MKMSPNVPKRPELKRSGMGPMFGPILFSGPDSCPLHGAKRNLGLGSGHGFHAWGPGYTMPQP